jgi:hypothetical protein
MRHRLAAFRRDQKEGWEIEFETPEGRTQLKTQTLIFATGGASWPETGSDGAWMNLFHQAKIPLQPFAPANVGYEVDWPAEFLAQAEGLPLKNVVVTAGGQSVAGELLVTQYGLEGGALYQLGPVLRGMARPEIAIDLKPSFTADELEKKAGSRPPSADQLSKAWKLSIAASELLRRHAPFATTTEAASQAKRLIIPLRSPRPLAEAISTAGGVRWEALDDDLMITTHPGIFCAGEMIEWEAPTGGYLLQGCFATATRAAQGATKFLQSGRSR